MSDKAGSEVRKVIETPGQRGGPEKLKATLALADRLLSSVPAITGIGIYFNVLGGGQTSLDKDDRKD